jgi:hypothetical protein
VPFAEGAAHAVWARGLIVRAAGRLDAAAGALREAAGEFERLDERAEAARCLRDLAALRRSQGAGAAEVAEVLRAALEFAGEARREPLVAALEQELRATDEGAYWGHACLRAGVADDPAPPSEAGTVVALAFDAPPGDADDPAVRLAVLNYLLAELEEALAGESVPPHYRGDGALLVATGTDHAARGVRAARRAVRVVAESNRPQVVLQRPTWQVRAAVASGTLRRAAVGTPRRLDRTAVGAPVDRAVALMASARPGVVRAAGETVRMLGPSPAFTPAGVPDAWDATPE